ncbi:hypothetical protein N8677_01850 [Verrucomicrobia bacterium]|nr:hypothetical protein [Verrucomicrobiota bacterium]
MNETAQKVKRNNLMNSTFSEDGSRASPRPQTQTAAMNPLPKILRQLKR